MWAKVLLASFAVALPLVSAVANPCPSVKQDARDAEVVLEVGFIIVSDDSSDRLGIDFSNGHGSGLSPSMNDAARLHKTVNDSFRNDGSSPTLLNGSRLREFLKEVQSDRQNYLRIAPKIRVSDGKTGEVRCTNQQYCLTGIEIVKEGDQTVFHPRCSGVETGLSASVRPTIAADRRAVRLKLQASLADVESPLHSKPLASAPITALPEMGWVGASTPIPLLGIYQHPRRTTLNSTSDLIVPDGGTALVGCWKQQHELIKASSPFAAMNEALSINRQPQIKNGGTGRKTDNILVMVTARIVPSKARESGRDSSVACKHDETRIKGEEEASRSDAEKKGEVTKLLKQYHTACSEGRLGEARKLALQAIELDPMCFETPR